MPNIESVRTTHEGRVFNVDVLVILDERGNHATREIVRHRGAVAIIPVLDDDRLVLVRNYRIATDQRLLEFPAGGIDADETPLDAGGRELEEETGFRSSRLTQLGTFYTTPGYSDELMHVVLAEGLTPGPQRLEPGEELEVELHSRAGILDMIRDGRIIDGKTIAAMYLWRLHLDGSTPA